MVHNYFGNSLKYSLKWIIHKLSGKHKGHALTSSLLSGLTIVHLTILSSLELYLAEQDSLFNWWILPLFLFL